MSWIGDFLSLTTVVLYLQGAGAGPAKVAVALPARALPQIAGPVAGTLADRVDPRRLMIGCDLGRLLLVGMVALTLPPFALFVAIQAVTSLLSTMFLPAGKGVVPKLVEAGHLGSANALLGMSQNLGVALGPAIGAELYAHAGPRTSFAVDALSFAASALLLTGLPRLGRAASPTTGSGRTTMRAAVRQVAADTRSGLAYVARHHTIRILAITLFLGITLAAMDSVAMVFLLRGELKASADSVGLATTMYGTGMILAPLLLLRSRRVPTAGFYVLGLALSGLGLLLVGITGGAIATVIACYAVGGFGNGLENVSCDTIIGSSVPQELLGRVFGAIYGPIFLANTAAAALGGALLSVLSPRSVFTIAGSGLLMLCGAVSMAFIRARGHQNSVPVKNDSVHHARTG